MKITLKPEPLTHERFSAFGSFARMTDPQSEKLGDAPIEFYRDLLPVSFGGGTLGFSTCKVQKRPYCIDTVEYHSGTREGILPLDQDILIHVAPASAGEPPLDKLRVFKIPKGTFVSLNPGVWHHAPFTIAGEPAHVLIILPERTYANDCFVVELEDADQRMIEY